MVLIFVCIDTGVCALLLVEDNSYLSAIRGLKRLIARYCVELRLIHSDNDVLFWSVELKKQLAKKGLPMMCKKNFIFSECNPEGTYSSYKTSRDIGFKKKRF